MQYDVLLPKKILKIYQAAGVTFALLLIFSLLSTYNGNWACSLYFYLMITGFLVSSYVRFRKNTIIQAKKASKILIRKTTTQLVANQQQLLVEQKKLKIIDFQYEKEINEIACASQKHAQRMLKEREYVIKEERSERWHQKKQYQEAYILRSMQQAMVVDANLPGIGDHLEKCLHAYSVRCAADVSRIRIRAIKGFGECKIATLILWRETIEQQAIETQPKQLPDPMLVRIEKKYKKKHQEIDKEDLVEQTRLANALDQVQSEMAYELYAQISKTKKIEDCVAHLENILEDLGNKSILYKKVTLSDYVLKNFFRLFSSQKVSV